MFQGKVYLSCSNQKKHTVLGWGGAGSFCLLFFFPKSASDSWNKTAWEILLYTDEDWLPVLIRACFLIKLPSVHSHFFSHLTLSVGVEMLPSWHFTNLYSIYNITLLTLLLLLCPALMKHSRRSVAVSMTR